MQKTTSFWALCPQTPYQGYNSSIQITGLHLTRPLPLGQIWWPLSSWIPLEDLLTKTLPKIPDLSLQGSIYVSHLTTSRCVTKSCIFYKEVLHESIKNSSVYEVSSQKWVTHTHTRLTALFPGLPRWAGTRKVKPIWILLKQETASGSGISWAICKSAPCSRQTTTPASRHSDFYRLDVLPAAQPTASKHWRQK